MKSGALLSHVAERQIKMVEQIKAEFIKAKELLDVVVNDDVFLQEIQQAGLKSIEALEKGHKILFAGNGGSAADAQHLAAELVCRYKQTRRALPAIALTTDSSALTAIGNDLGFDMLFARQIEALGQEGDIYLAISTSGNSKNIIESIKSAKTKGVFVIGLTGGKGGTIDGLCDLCLKVPSTETARIQECHIKIGHIICNMIEEHFALESHSELVSESVS